MGGVFKLLRGPAMDMIGKFAQSSGLVNSAVTLPMKGVIEEVRSGQIWVGPGADKFLAVLTDERVPASEIISSQLTQMHTNFVRSIELIDETDNQCKSSFVSLGDTFSKVF